MWPGAHGETYIAHRSTPNPGIVVKIQCGNGTDRYIPRAQGVGEKVGQICRGATALVGRWGKQGQSGAPFVVVVVIVSGR